jgi:hypothetical protein
MCLSTDYQNTLQVTQNFNNLAMTGLVHSVCSETENSFGSLRLIIRRPHNYCCSMSTQKQRYLSGLDGRGLDPGRVKIFLFAIASRSSLKSIQPHFKYWRSFPRGECTWPLTSTYCRCQEGRSHISTPSHVLIGV